MCADILHLQSIECQPIFATGALLKAEDYVSLRGKQRLLIKDFACWNFSYTAKLSFPRYINPGEASVTASHLKAYSHLSVVVC